MIPTLSLTTLLVAAAPVVQGVQIAAQDEVRLAWREFQRVHGQTWTAEWCPATGTPKAIFGPGLRVQDDPIDGIGTARRHANATLDAHRGLLALGASRFVEDIAHHQGRLSIFVYRQTFAGLPVIEGRADVRVHDTGVVSMFGAQAVPIPADFLTTPTLAPELARALALADREITRPREPGPGVARPDTELVIWADVDGREPTAPRLAWQVRVDQREGRLVVGRVWVDAHSGAILEFADDVHNCGRTGCDGVHAHADSEPCPAGHAHAADAGAPPRADIIGSVLGWTNVGLRPWDQLVNVPMVGIEVTAQGVGTAFTDANGDFRIPYTGTNPVQVTVAMQGRHVGSMVNTGTQTLSGTATATPGTPVVIQLLTQSDTAVRACQTTAYHMTDDVNRWVRSILGNTPQLDALDGTRVTVNLPQSCNAFYTANTINFYASSSTCYNTAYSTVVEHEWGHGLDDAYGGISRTDGLSEGWADVVAIMRTQQPVVGEDFFFSGRDVRTALNTLTYPLTGGVHTQGQTWMGWCWDVRTNLVASLGQAQGEALAAGLFIGSLPANARNQPDAVREVFLLDDDDGDLTNGTPHYNALAQAAMRRRLPFPRVNFGAVTHTQLADTAEQLTPRIVRVGAVPAFGSYPRANVFYDDGNGFTQQAMVPSGNPNEFIALIPGYLSPKIVPYHVEVEHSTGFVERLPPTGEFDFRIGQEVVHFFDDFEGGPLGWTHSRRFGSDDWVFGTPAGASGNSGGIQWYDPQGAFSGQGAWGNDLGLAGNDGAYPASSDNWLLTPQLNLALVTGATLTYRRWLTVDDNANDKAEIRVGSTVVWSNPAGDAFGDNEWVEHSLGIPQADQNPIAQVGFHLISDSSAHLGGWNVDDVKISSFVQLPPPKVKYTITPPQIALGATANLLVEGSRSRPMAILLSLSPGPLILPGLPPFAVGPNFIAAAGFFDGQGRLGFSFQAPTDASASGALIYTQSLELTVRNTIEVSNPMVILYGP